MNTGLNNSINKHMSVVTCVCNATNNFPLSTDLGNERTKFVTTAGIQSYQTTLKTLQRHCLPRSVYEHCFQITYCHGERDTVGRGLHVRV